MVVGKLNIQQYFAPVVKFTQNNCSEKSTLIKQTFALIVLRPLLL